MITRPSFVMLATFASLVVVDRYDCGAQRKSSAFPDGDVLAALAREGRAAPVAPALAQGQAGELSHQVELRRPDVTERHGQELPAPVDEGEVVRDEALVRHVVF